MRADLHTKPLRGMVFRDHDSAIRDGEHVKLYHLEGRVEFLYSMYIPCVEHGHELLRVYYCSTVRR